LAVGIDIEELRSCPSKGSAVRFGKDDRQTEVSQEGLSITIEENVRLKKVGKITA
jgi:hypothetical protein